MSSAIFSSSSAKLRQQLQALLLRYWIVSKNHYGGTVTVRGPSLKVYAERVGFLHKSGEIKSTKFYPQRESVPYEMFITIKNIRKLIPQVNSKGWYKDKEGKSRRTNIYWNHSDVYAKHTTWDHIQNWWDDVGDNIEKLSPIVAKRVKFLLETKFLWQEVISIKDSGKRRVLDISLPAGPELLAHGYTANGFINHNSFGGQTVTLDYDHTAGYESAIGRIREDIENRLPEAKQRVFRKAEGLGVAGVRPLSPKHMLLMRTERYLIQNYWEVITSLGLI